MSEPAKPSDDANDPLLGKTPDAARRHHDDVDGEKIPLQTRMVDSTVDDNQPPAPEKPEPKPQEDTPDITDVPLVSPRLFNEENDYNTDSSEKHEDHDGGPVTLVRNKEETQGRDLPSDIVVEHSVDVSTHTEKHVYKRYLMTIINDKKALRDALHENVRKKFPKKLRITCRILKNRDISLVSDNMLGDTSKESPLCLAAVVGSTECAHILIEFGGTELISMSYQTKAHLGVTALHLAILNQNVPVIENMLNVLNEEAKATLLHIRATGTHFENRFNCACLPLSLAAGLGNITIFNTLVRHGADLWIGDEETGNTVLHSLATIAVHRPNTAIETMKAILDSEDVQVWWECKKQSAGSKKFTNMSLKTALLKAENVDGHTPLIYASCLGADKFVQAILDIENLYKFPQWEVGPSSYVLYDVSEIDTAVSESTYPDPPNPVTRQSTERAKILEIFTFVLSDESLDLGNIAIMKHAMLNKWNAFKKWFFAWMILHFLTMTAFTMSAKYYVRSTDNTSAILPDDNTTHSDSPKFIDLLQSGRNQFILFLDCFVLLVSLVYFVLELSDIGTLLSKRYWRARGFDRTRRVKIPIYLTLQFDVFRCLLFTFSASVLLIFFLKLNRSPWQDFAYASAAISGWSFMLFFTRAFRDIGIFTVMLQRMVTRELFYFAVVFVVIMAGFSTASYCLFQESHVAPPEEVSSMSRTFYSHFRLLIGLEDFAIAHESRLPLMMKLVFISFVVLSNILLLNMLIAAMNNTYTQLDNLKELMWLKMRTKAVLLLERRLIKPWRPKSKLKRFGRAHQWFLASEEVTAWHPLAGGTDLVL